MSSSLNRHALLGATRILALGLVTTHAADDSADGRRSPHSAAAAAAAVHKPVAAVAPKRITTVCLDLDGTLLGANHEASEATVGLLRKLSGDGVCVVLATGRSGPAVYVVVWGEAG